MRKSIIVMLVSFALLLLSSCGASNSDSSDNITLFRYESGHLEITGWGFLAIIYGLYFIAWLIRFALGKDD